MQKSSMSGDGDAVRRRGRRRETTAHDGDSEHIRSRAMSDDSTGLEGVERRDDGGANGRAIALDYDARTRLGGLGRRSLCRNRTTVRFSTTAWNSLCFVASRTVVSVGGAGVDEDEEEAGGAGDDDGRWGLFSV